MESLFISESLKSIRMEPPMSRAKSGFSGPVGGGGLEYAAINWAHDNKWHVLKAFNKQQNTFDSRRSIITGYVVLVISTSFCFALRSASLASFRSCFRWSASFSLKSFRSCFRWSASFSLKATKTRQEFNFFT